MDIKRKEKYNLHVTRRSEEERTNVASSMHETENDESSISRRKNGVVRYRKSNQPSGAQKGWVVIIGVDGYRDKS